MSTKRSIPFEFFAPNQFMYFDLGRLAALERELGAPIVSIVAEIEDGKCGVGFIVGVCRHGLAHHYPNKPGAIEKMLDKYIEDGGDIFDVEFLFAICRAILASGVFGKELADKAVKNELDKADEEAATDDEKNAQAPVSE